MKRWSQGAGWAAVATGTLLFSTGGILIRHIHLPPLAITFWSQLVTMLAVMAWQWRILRSPPFKLLQKRATLYQLLALGVVVAVDRAAFTAAIWLAPVAKVLVVAYLYPVYTMLLAHWFLNERMTARTALAALTALFGTVILVWPDLQPASASDLPGLLLAGVVSVAVAIGRVLLKSIDRSVPTPLIMLAESTLATIILAPVAVLTAPVPVPREAAALLLLSGVLYGVLAHAIVLAGLRVVAAGPAATIGYLEPVAASLLAWWLLSEPLSAYIVVGGTLTLAGSLAAMLIQLNAPAAAPIRYKKGGRSKLPP